MTTDQASQGPSDKSSQRAGLIVGVIGVLLCIVLLCGILLRNAGDGQAPARTQSNLTAVPPETLSADDGREDPQPIQTTASELSAQGASPLSQLPDHGELATPVDDVSSATEPPRPDGPTASAESASGTLLATLEPMETDGIQQGPGGLWQPAVFSGVRYERALCMARASVDSTSQISFSLGGNFAHLSGIAGLQDVQDGSQSNDSDRSAVIFRIYGDANLLWDSEPLTTAGATERFQLEVTGLDILTLVVENGFGTDGAQPAWADLQLNSVAGEDLAPNSDREPDGDVGEP